MSASQLPTPAVCTAISTSLAPGTLGRLLSHDSDRFEIELRRGEGTMKLSIPMTKLVPYRVNGASSLAGDE